MQSDEEYESIKADVAKDFGDVAKESASSGPASNALEGCLPENEEFARAARDKAAVLDNNPFWPESAKRGFANRLAKTMSMF